MQDLEGWNDSARRQAPLSPYHTLGQRKELTVALHITVSVPHDYDELGFAEQLAYTLLADPYVREVVSPDHELFKPIQEDRR